VDPKFTLAPLTKPFPNAVMVKEPIPSCEGEIDESCGIGLTTVRVAVELNDEVELTVAVIFSGFGVGIWDGAVYCANRPSVGAIEPTETLPF